MWTEKGLLINLHLNQISFSFLSYFVCGNDRQRSTHNYVQPPVQNVMFLKYQMGAAKMLE